MSPENFELPLLWIGPKIRKVTTEMREPIRVGQRLCVTLRHLAIGDAHVTITASYRMSYCWTYRKRKRCSNIVCAVREKICDPSIVRRSIEKIFGWFPAKIELF